MRLIGSSTDPADPIDAVLDGADRDQADLLAVAAVVHDVLAAYTRSEPLEVREELAAYCGAHPVRSPSGKVGAAAAVVAPTGALGRPAARARTTGGRGPMLRRLTAFTGTVAGKVILTSTVAAACAGGLHATGAVDVPALPDADQPDEPPEPIGSHARQEPDPVDGDPPASADADERGRSTDDESDDGRDDDGWDDDGWDDDGWDGDGWDDDDREARSDGGDGDDVDDGEGDADTADERDSDSDGDGSTEPADAAGPTSNGSTDDSNSGP